LGRFCCIVSIFFIIIFVLIALRRSRQQSTTSITSNNTSTFDRPSLSRTQSASSQSSGLQNPNPSGTKNDGFLSNLLKKFF
jgi:hypothetical protein